MYPDLYTPYEFSIALIERNIDTCAEFIETVTDSHVVPGRLTRSGPWPDCCHNRLLFMYAMR